MADQIDNGAGIDPPDDIPPSGENGGTSGGQKACGILDALLTEKAHAVTKHNGVLRAIDGLAIALLAFVGAVVGTLKKIITL